VGFFGGVGGVFVGTEKLSSIDLEICLESAGVLSLLSTE
jgi:hypothetical protein